MELLLIFLIIGLICAALFYSTLSTKYCNSRYNRGENALDIKLSDPKWKVHNIKRVSLKNTSGDIAEYTLWNFYITGKRRVKHQELVFYGKIGKYNLGDTIVFSEYSPEE